jgi:hypothetical protein
MARGPLACGRGAALVAALGVAVAACGHGPHVDPGSAARAPAVERRGTPAQNPGGSGLSAPAHPGPVGPDGKAEQLWPQPPVLVSPTGSPVVWTPAGIEGPGGAVVFTTTVPPATGAAPVGVAWIDQAHASVALFAGTTQPGGSFACEGMVPAALQPDLAAAFEGGFQFAVSGGGFEEDGVVGAPLVAGGASMVELSSGRIEIGAWGSEVGPGPGVVAVRQNLTLLVDHGTILPTVNDNPLVTWGYSLGNLLATWRSGVGITGDGNLVWVGGPGLSPAALAAMLVWAGAVRGMQLDINPDWVNFATYAPGQVGVVGQNLLPGMVFAPSHYLVPFWRDFVAVFVNTSGAVSCAS